MGDEEQTLLRRKNRTNNVNESAAPSEHDRRRGAEHMLPGDHRLRLAAEAAHFGTYEFKPVTGELFWSAELREICGLSATDPVSMERAVDLIHPEDRAAVVAKMNQALRASEPGDYEFEFRIKRPDGRVRWVLDRGRIIERYGASGERAVHGLGTVIDITERKQVEQRLRRSNQRLEILSEAARLLLASETPTRLIQIIGERLMKHLECDVFFNYLLAGDSSRLHLNAYVGISDEMAKSLEYPDLGDAVCASVAANGEIIVGQNLADTSDSRMQIVRSLGIQAYACYPLVFQGRAIGTLSFGTKNSPTFTPDDLDLMEAVANLAAAAMARKQGEESLRRSEAQLRTVLDALPVGVWMVDAAGTVIYGNPAGDQIWAGASASGTVRRGNYKGWRAITGEPIGPGDWPVSRALLKGEVHLNDVIEIECFDGTRKTIHNSALPVKGGDGRILGAVIVNEDITDRMHALEEREALLIKLAQSFSEANRSRAELQAVFEAMQDGLVVFDMEGNAVLINEAQAKITAYARAEDLKQNLETFTGIYELRDPAGRLVPVAQWPVSRILRGETLNGCEVRARRKDTGTEWYFSVSGSPVYDEDGKQVLAVTVTRDISARKRAEAALRERESFYRQTLESIPGMVFTAPPDGSVDYLNEQWVEFTGVSTSQLLGAGWIQVLHPDDRDRAYSAWCTAVQNGSAYDIEYRVRRYDGPFEWFKARARPIRNAADQTVGWFGAASNVDDLKRAEQALQEADRRKDEFLAVLAHELRNPLAPIRNVVQILRSVSPAEAQLDWCRNIIDEQVEHMARLMEDLLDVSRITRGKLELRNEQIDLRALLTNAVETARPQVDAAGQRLTVNLPQEAMRLKGDRVRLSQVFSNLLNNAAKYTEAGGQIWITAERQENDGVVAVKDNGIGIASELLPGIFEMFVQVDSSMGRSQGGLGLGLTLARELVRLHGGSITARSAGRGHGSEFVVRLPLVQGGVHDHNAPDRDQDRAASKISRRILVVDDSAVQAKSLAMVLKLSGHDVRMVGSAQEALQMLEHFTPDIALVDIGLPGMNGYELARAIRIRPEWKRLVLIAQTGWGRDEDRNRSRDAGFDHHLTKPIDHRLLRDILAAPLPGAAESE